MVDIEEDLISNNHSNQLANPANERFLNLNVQMEDESDGEWPEVHGSLEQYPMALVWCPLPMLTWLIPVVGHVGMSGRDGVVHDFVGPFRVVRQKGRLGFGKVHRYYALRPSDFPKSHPQETSSQLARRWENALDEADRTFLRRPHLLFTSNCHSHVAVALNRMQFRGKSNWNTYNLMFFLALHGQFVNISRALFVYFIYILSLLVILGVMILGVVHTLYRI